MNSRQYDTDMTRGVRHTSTQSDRFWSSHAAFISKYFFMML